MPLARYSNSLMLSSWERCGWATRRSASASRCSASARSRSRLPTWTIRAGETSAATSFRLGVASSGPAITSSSFAAASGSAARQPADGLDQRPRVAPVAAEAPGVDERDALGVEQTGRPRAAGRHQPRGPSRWERAAARRSRARAGRRRPARRRRRRRRRRRASGARGAGRAPRCAAVGNSGRIGSNVHASRRSATQGTPRRWSAIPTAWADSGGELVITQSKRRSRCSRSARERANGAQAATSASGTKTLLSGCGRPL